MQPRSKLQSLLESLADINVYFQPPSTVKMTYPCIVYTRSSGRTAFADNYPYSHHKRYTVTLIGKDPDSPVFDKIAELQGCTYDRHFTADGLHHDVFSIYF